MRTDTNQLMEKWKDNLFAVAFNICKNAEDAEDAVQETFIQYHFSNKQFDSENHLKSWVLRVAINRAKDINRSWWKKRCVTLEDYMAENIVFETEEEQSLFEEVMKLPTKYRIVIHLHYYENYSVREIAKIVSTTESNVKIRLMRARNMLKQYLKEE